MSGGARYAFSVVFTITAVVLTWQSAEALARAQRLLASTFELQPARFALADLLLGLAGVSIAVLILINAGRIVGSGGPLLVASLIPLAMVTVVVLFLNGVEFGIRVGEDWLFSPSSQAIASFMFGLLATLGLTTTRAEKPVIAG